MMKEKYMQYSQQPSYQESTVHIFELRMKEEFNWEIITVMYATYVVVQRKPEKNWGLNRVQTHDLYYTLV